MPDEFEQNKMFSRFIEQNNFTAIISFMGGYEPPFGTWREWHSRAVKNIFTGKEYFNMSETLQKIYDFCKEDAEKQLAERRQLDYDEYKSLFDN